MTELRPATAPISTENLEPQQVGIRFERRRNRLRRAEQVVRQHAGQDGGHRTYSIVQMTRRAENADRHVALRILRFLRGCRDRIEADVGEEDDRGGAQQRRSSRSRPPRCSAE